MVCLQPNVISFWLSGNVFLKTSDILGLGDPVLAHYSMITLCSCQLVVMSSGARSACANLGFIIASRRGSLNLSVKNLCESIVCLSTCFNQSK